MTIVDRSTRCILGWKLVWERTKESIQTLVDDAPAVWFGNILLACNFEKNLSKVTFVTFTRNKKTVKRDNLILLSALGQAKWAGRKTKPVAGEIYEVPA